MYAGPWFCLRSYDTLQPIDINRCLLFIMSLDPVYSAPHAPMLLEVLRERIQAKHYSERTAKSYTHWVSRFVHFHHKQHPRDMGAPEVEASLTDPAMNGKTSPAMLAFLGG